MERYLFFRKNKIRIVNDTDMDLFIQVETDSELVLDRGHILHHSSYGLEPVPCTFSMRQVVRSGDFKDYFHSSCQLYHVYIFDHSQNHILRETILFPGEIWVLQKNRLNLPKPKINIPLCLGYFILGGFVAGCVLALVPC